MRRFGGCVGAAGIGCLCGVLARLDGRTLDFSVLYGTAVAIVAGVLVWWCS